MLRRLYCRIVFVWLGVNAVFLYGLFAVSRRFRDDADGLSLRLLERFIRSLPKNIDAGLEAGAMFGRLVFFVGAGKKKCLVNLRIAFGKEYSDEKINGVLKKYYGNLARHIFELFYFYTMSEDDIKRRIKVDADVMAEIREKNKTSGVQILTLHANSLNMLASVLGLFFDEFYPHAAEQPHRLLDMFLDRIRIKCRSKLLKKSAFSAVTMLKKLKKRAVIGMAADYNTDRPKLFHPFFGTDASVVASVYFFAARAKCPVYFIALVPLGGFNYRMEAKEITYDAAGSDGEITNTVVAEYFKEVEAFVRQRPEEYIWHNKRWSKRPEGDKREFYRMEPDELKRALRIKNGE